MALSTKYKAFAAPLATGNQAVTGFGFLPKLLLLSSTRLTADGFNPTSFLSFGAAVSSTQRKAIAIACDDNAVTSNTARRHADKAVSILTDGTNTSAPKAEADLVSMDADGFTLNWGIVGPSAYIVSCLALGGSDITAVKVGEFDASIVTGNQAVTGVGFQPDGILLFSVGDETVLPATTTNASISLGAASSAAASGTSTYRNRDGINPTQLIRHQNAARVLEVLTNLSISGGATLVSLDSDGFTLNWVFAPSAAQKVFYVALQGPRIKVGAETQKTSTGTKATTGLGFTPSALLAFSSNQTAGASFDLGAGRFSVGMAAGTTSGDQGTGWTGGTDNVSPTVEDRYRKAGALLAFANNGGTGTVEAEGSLASLDANGFTINWTAADATAREFIYVAIGSSALPPGAILAVPALATAVAIPPSFGGADVVAVPAEATASVNAPVIISREIPSQGDLVFVRNFPAVGLTLSSYVVSPD